MQIHMKFFIMRNLFYIGLRYSSPEGEEYGQWETEGHHRDEVASHVQGVDQLPELYRKNNEPHRSAEVSTNSHKFHMNANSDNLS